MFTVHGFVLDSQLTEFMVSCGLCGEFSEVGLVVAWGRLPQPGVKGVSNGEEWRWGGRYLRVGIVETGASLVQRYAEAEHGVGRVLISHVAGQIDVVGVRRWQQHVACQQLQQQHQQQRASAPHLARNVSVVAVADVVLVVAFDAVVVVGCVVAALVAFVVVHTILAGVLLLFLLLHYLLFVFFLSLLLHFRSCCCCRCRLLLELLQWIGS